MIKNSYNLKKFNIRSFSTSIKGVMKSVEISKFGGVEVLNINKNTPIPSPKPGEILVKVHATSINPIDINMRSGYTKAMLEKFVIMPIILGRDCSGTVVATGSEVWNIKVGDEVFAATHPFSNGCYAEYVALKESEVALKPKSINHTEAAFFPYISLTAWRALVDTANVQSGQKVLIHGGGGSIGSFSIQYLKNEVGCTVATTCSKEDIDKVKSYGADLVFDYRDSITGFDSQLHDYDIVLDIIGNSESERKSIKILKKAGHYMSLLGPLVKTIDNYGVFLGTFFRGN